MAKQKQIKWLPILQEISEWCEEKFDISIVIDKDIIVEIEAMVDITLAACRQISTYQLLNKQIFVFK